MNANRRSRVVVLGAALVGLSLAGQAAPGHGDRAFESYDFDRSDAAVHGHGYGHGRRRLGRRRIHVPAAARRNRAVRRAKSIRAARQRHLRQLLRSRSDQRDDDGDQRRGGRRVRLRGAGRRHGELLGARRVGPARRRHDEHIRGRSCPGERHHDGRRRCGRVQPRLRAPGQWRDALLGVERRRTTRKPVDAARRIVGTGGRERHRRSRRDRDRRLSHLRVAPGQHAALLGPQRSGAAR